MKYFISIADIKARGIPQDSTLGEIKPLNASEYVTVEVPDACEHVSDGLVYTSLPPKYKCKKCGAFYYEDGTAARDS